MKRFGPWSVTCLAAATALLAVSCASAPRGEITAPAPSAAEAGTPVEPREGPGAPAEPDAATPVEPSEPEAGTVPSDKPSSPLGASVAERERILEKGPCLDEPAAGEEMVDRTRQRLYRTVCGAALWFDGLFGEERNVDAAQRAFGRVELSFTESEYYGFKQRTRFNARVRLPNLEQRVEAFFGRDDEDEFIQDRNEGFALRSQFPNLETEDRWVLGLGYGLPGSYAKRSDFRVGAKGGRRPEVFVQGRQRRNWFVGDRSLWHFRDTAFWTNRDGFGNTLALDFDHILTSRMLMRVGSVGTFSEATDGVDYRFVTVFYQNLSASGRALAYELFARGETDLEIQPREYGLRTVFRRPVGGRDWLFGELIAGYSWVREARAETRAGSYLVGFGIELLYGRENPYRR